jgi:hypothetical protein
MVLVCMQAVFELYNISATRVEWGPGEARISRVVVIGRSLHRTALAEWFAAVQATAAEELEAAARTQDAGGPQGA